MFHRIGPLAATATATATATAAAITVAFSIAVPAAAWAADHGRASRIAPLPLYQQECASCHVAYPPGLLPTASWQRLMGNLSRHYGADASLDPATVRELSGWLAANAATYRRVGQTPPPEDRISRSAWFVRKHDEVPVRTWRSPAVKSPSNCSACHAQAEQGDFDEHNVRIPR